MTESKQTFEEQLKELEEIVQKLEQGDVPLEESLTEFKKGMALSRSLRQTLTDADEMMVKIMDESGEEVDFEGDH